MKVTLKRVNSLRRVVPANERGGEKLDCTGDLKTRGKRNHSEK